MSTLFACLAACLRRAARGGPQEPAARGAPTQARTGVAQVDARDDNEETALLLAARHGHLDAVKLLVGCGANVNLRGGSSRRTALMEASCRNDAEMTGLLLDHGAKVNERDLDGVSALMLACSKGSTEAAQVLLDRGADVDKGADDGVTALMRACKAGHVATAAMLLDRGAQIDLRDNKGRTSLMLACQAGYARIAGVLLDRGAQLELQDTDGNTALILACEGGHSIAAEVLLDSGARVGARDGAGRSALSLASVNGHAETARLLRLRSAWLGPDVLLAQACECGETETVAWLLDRGAGLDEHHDRGVTALMIASRRGHTEIAQLLLTRGAQVDLRDAAGSTALIIASKHQQLGVTKVLLRHGAQVDLRDDRGTTSLMAVCNADTTPKPRSHGGQMPLHNLMETPWPPWIAALLLEHGAQVNLRDAAGNTALMMACKHQQLSVINLLLLHGAQVDLHGKHGLTAMLMAASELGDTDFARRLLDSGAEKDPRNAAGDTALITACKHKRPDVIKLLLKRGAQVNLQGSGGTTALMAVCSAETAKPRNLRFRDRRKSYMTSPTDEPWIDKTVRLLLEHGAQVNLRDAAGNTALMMACKHQQLSVINLLLQHGAEVDLQGEYGLTAMLMAASKRGDTDFAQLLLDCGAEKDSRDAAGDTALISACKNQKTDVIKLLLERGAQVDLQGNGGTTALMAVCNFGLDKPPRSGPRLMSARSQFTTAEAPFSRFLLGLDAPVNVPGNEANTELTKSEVVKLLLERGAQVDLRDDCGLTALMLVSRRGDTDVAQMLLDRGAEIDSRDAAGDTALIVACKHHEPNSIKLLLERGAQVNLQGDHGLTALMAVCNAKPLQPRFRNGDRQVVQTPMDEPWIHRIVRLFLDRGAQVNVRDNKGRTALMLATVRLHFENVQLLLARGAQVNLRDEKERTALMLACKSSLPEYRVEEQDSLPSMVSGNPHFKSNAVHTVEALIEGGADLDLEDAGGSCALSFAVDKRNNEVAALLLNRGANLNFSHIPSGKAQDALTIASRVGFLEVLELISRRVRVTTTKGGRKAFRGGRPAKAPSSKQTRS